MCDLDGAEMEKCIGCGHDCSTVYSTRETPIAICDHCMPLIRAQYEIKENLKTDRGLTAIETIAFGFTQMLCTLPALQRGLATLTVETAIRKGFEMAKQFFGESEKTARPS